MWAANTWKNATWASRSWYGCVSVVQLIGKRIGAKLPAYLRLFKPFGLK